MQKECSVLKKKKKHNINTHNKPLRNERLTDGQCHKHLKQIVSYMTQGNHDISNFLWSMVLKIGFT